MDEAARKDGSKKAVDAAERERKAFKRERRQRHVESVLLAGKRSWHNSIKPCNVKVDKNGITASGTQFGTKLPCPSRTTPCRTRSAFMR